MDSCFTFEFKGKYILITHRQDYELSLESTEKLWAELSRECREHKCLKVLHEGPAPENKMSIIQAFLSGEKASQVLPGLQLAVCLPGFVTDEPTKMFINAAFNRGVDVELFQDRSKALEWLGVKDTG